MSSVGGPGAGGMSMGGPPVSAPVFVPGILAGVAENEMFSPGATLYFQCRLCGSACKASDKKGHFASERHKNKVAEAVESSTRSLPNPTDGHEFRLQNCDFCGYVISNDTLEERRAHLMRFHERLVGSALAMGRNFPENVLQPLRKQFINCIIGIISVSPLKPVPLEHVRTAINDTYQKNNLVSFELFGCSLKNAIRNYMGSVVLMNDNSDETGQILLDCITNGPSPTPPAMNWPFYPSLVAVSTSTNVPSVSTVTSMADESFWDATAPSDLEDELASVDINEVASGGEHHAAAAADMVAEKALKIVQLAAERGLLKSEFESAVAVLLAEDLNGTKVDWPVVFERELKEKVVLTKLPNDDWRVTLKEKQKVPLSSQQPPSDSADQRKDRSPAFRAQQTSLPADLHTPMARLIYWTVLMYGQDGVMSDTEIVDQLKVNFGVKYDERNFAVLLVENMKYFGVDLKDEDTLLIKLKR